MSVIARRRRYRVYILLGVFILSLFYLWPSSESDLQETNPYRTRIRFEKSSFDWKKAKQYNPVRSVTPLPRGKPRRLGKIQHRFSSTQTNDPINRARAVAVRNAFARCWDSYSQRAWLHDELTPVTGKAKDNFGGWAATLVDSLDTLWIMDFKPEFYEAAEAVAQLNWSNTNETGINVFETTIRHLGGLLGAYDLSGEPALLLKAKELGDMLYMAFDTPNRMPPFWLTFENALEGTQVAGTYDPGASPASLSLEFTRLAQLTGEDRFYDAIERVRAFLARTQDKSRVPGMWPTMINFRDEKVDVDKSFTLGALSDSLYEYLPKMSILLGGLESSYEAMYRKAMDAVMAHILFRPMLPGKEDILFSGMAIAHNNVIRTFPESQHLACFVGGMFAVGGRTFGIKEHVKTGERIARGCAWAYQAFPTGLMPEIFSLFKCESLDGCEWDAEKWEKDGDQSLKEGFENARVPKYHLRPEAIESLFVLYRVTGNEEWREMAWTMFQNIIIATETPLANSAIKDVTVTGETEKLDSMESFWMAETLKYFYLIFSPADVVSLDEFVLNTEAHPLRRPR